jgi:hypothetical protein
MTTPQMDGPTVQIAALCRRIAGPAESEGGAFSVIGILERFKFFEQEAPSPELGYQIENAFLYLRLCAGRKRSFTLAFKVLPPKGALVDVRELDFEFPPDSDVHPVQIEFLAKLPMPGLYRIEILADGEFLTVVPFEVEHVVSKVPVLPFSSGRPSGHAS